MLFRSLADQLVGEAERGEPEPASTLTGRQEKVLHGILSGLTNWKIARQIGVSESTVKGVVRQLFRRAGVRTRAQLVRAALDGSLGAAREMAKRGRNRLPLPTMAHLDASR